MDDMMKLVYNALGVCKHLRPKTIHCPDCAMEREEADLARMNYSEEFNALRSKRGE